MTIELEKFQFRPAVRLTLPKEHGSWSLALEPVALGLLVAPSSGGAALAIVAIAVFFLRLPVKILFRGTDCNRRKIALASVSVLAAIAFAGLLIAAKIGGVEKLWPLVPAALAGLSFVWFDSRNESREGAAEISGAFVFGILPAAFATLAGWNFIAAISLAAVMLARSVPTILFVRTFLRIRKGRKAVIAPAIVAAIVSFLLVALLVYSTTAPWLAAAFAFAMALRAVFLLRTPPNVSPKAIGIAEAILGATMVLTLAIAWKMA
jgi:hypothetical protein